MKILIIEDSPEIVESVQLIFQVRWPGVELLSASEGERGMELAKTESPDLIILDLGLPDRDGLDVLPEIRSFSNAPLIILTARGDEVNKVKGLELGADDYIVKPFSPAELSARVRAVVRRSKTPTSQADLGPVIRKRLKIDYAAQGVSIGNKSVKLAPSVFKLLCHLVSNEGKVLSTQTLLESLVGKEYTAEVDYVNVYIRHLRDKLEENPSNPKMILGDPREGYRFVSGQ
jgi:DNA-binding response OmpR family regulator